jgi:hypothetical protein
MTPTVARNAVMTMLAISQKPERVSNILRSSTCVTPDKGIARGVARTGKTVPAVMAVMLLLRLVGWRR